MNSVWACFLIGLTIGLISGSFAVYKLEEVKALSLQNKYDSALLEANNKVIETERNGRTITERVINDYQKKFAAIKPVTHVVFQTDPNSSLPAVSEPSCTVDELKLKYLRIWIKDEVAAFNTGNSHH